MEVKVIVNYDTSVYVIIRCEVSKCNTSGSGSDMQQPERWSIIRDFPRFEVSTFGRVRRLRDKKEMKTPTNSEGYAVLNLSGDEHCPMLRKVHRLVAEAFLPNPNKKECVDHINRVRNDNHISNLRWATPKENRRNVNRAKR